MSMTYDCLSVGDSFSVTRKISSEDVRTFAHLTGHNNPLHVDPEYAKDMGSDKPIIHCVLLIAVFSKILGHDFPGHGTIAVSLSSRCLSSAPVGGDIEFYVQVTEKIEKRKQVKVHVNASHNNEDIIIGDVVMIPPTDGER